MLYAIKQGKVEGYQGQREIIYLIAAAEEIASRGLSLVFTDGHAIISYVNHYNRLEDLPRLYWNEIQAAYWNNFMDGRCRRQAEFLVRDEFPLDLVREIGVMDTEMKNHVGSIIVKSSFQPLIQMHREWYF